MADCVHQWNETTNLCCLCTVKRETAEPGYQQRLHANCANCALVIETLFEVLKAGQHEGPCDEDANGTCMLHYAAAKARDAKAQELIHRVAMTPSHAAIFLRSMRTGIDRAIIMLEHEADPSELVRGTKSLLEGIAR